MAERTESLVRQDARRRVVRRVWARHSGRALKSVELRQGLFAATWPGSRGTQRGLAAVERFGFS